MRRAVALLLVLVLVAGLAAQQPPTETTMPETVFVFTDDTVTVTWTGPLLYQLDNETELAFTLPPATAKLPAKKKGAAELVIAGCALAAGLLLGLRF